MATRKDYTRSTRITRLQSSRCSAAQDGCFGTGDMIKRCRNFGLDEPEFALTDGFVVTIRRKPELAFKAVGGVTEQVTEQVQRLLTSLTEGPASSAGLMELLRLSHRPSFLYSYLQPAIAAGLVEMTIPEKPQSRRQKYRLTQKGRDLAEKMKSGGG